MLIRLLLVIIGLILITRLLSIIIRTVKALNQKTKPKKKGLKEEVGEGWIVDDDDKSETD